MEGSAEGAGRAERSTVTQEAEAGSKKSKSLRCRKGKGIPGLGGTGGEGRDEG